MGKRLKKNVMMSIGFTVFKLTLRSDTGNLNKYILCCYTIIKLCSFIFSN